MQLTQSAKRGSSLRVQTIAGFLDQKQGGVVKCRAREKDGERLGRRASNLWFLFGFQSCIRLFNGTKNSHAAVSNGVNKIGKTNK